MKLFLLVVMVTACAASPQDLSGKMFIFPQETNTARVVLTALKSGEFSAVTVCHRSFTELRRDHSLFSLATSTNFNEFLIFWNEEKKMMQPHVKVTQVGYVGLDYKPNMWHSICTTWDASSTSSTSGLVQLWFDGQPMMKKYVSAGSGIRGTTIIILGQEQDSHGGGFDLKQSFVGMMSDVHMWDYILSPCEIQKYVDELNFTPGNVLNWSAMELQITDRMKLLLLMVMLTACAARPQDLSGKMFTFPQETNTARVKLIPSRQDFSAVTVCHRSFTDLDRSHILFSLSTPSAANDFLVFKASSTAIHLYARNKKAILEPGDYKLNMWHSICSTWDSTTGLVQLWFDGQPSSKMFASSGSDISGTTVILLGQEQDSHGGGFDLKQSFVGMMSDVHMWDHTLSTCEIQEYMEGLNFTPGNVLNWSALEFQIIDRVLIEDKLNKLITCH